jgi:glycosyltransferase involved in cell wall biosynthesis
MSLPGMRERVSGALRRWMARAHMAKQAARVRRHGRKVESLVRASEPGLLSVLVPARGAEPYIGECLASILGQALPEGLRLEVLVGIDACERTRGAVVRFLATISAGQAERVRVLFYPDPLGAYVMQNSLVLASRGEWVHIVGADDALGPDALAPLCRFAAECAACTPAFILRPMGFLCDEHLARLPGKPALPIKGAIFFSKGILAKLGGFAPWSCAGDADFLRRADRKNLPTYVCPLVSYLYRQHNVQLSRMAGTHMKSEIRTRYWRMTDRRIARGEIREIPVVGQPQDGADGCAPFPGATRTDA